MNQLQPLSQLPQIRNHFSLHLKSLCLGTKDRLYMKKARAILSNGNKIQKIITSSAFMITGEVSGHTYLAGYGVHLQQC